MTWTRLGEILCRDHGLTAARLEEALTAQQSSTLRLGEILLAGKQLTAEILAQALATQHDLPFLAGIAPEQLAGELLAGIPIGFAKDYKIFPLQRGRG